MSHAPATQTKEGASPRSTRQLLDELDALMNKMLELPVEDEAGDRPTPALKATLTLIEPEPPLPAILGMADREADPSRENRAAAIPITRTGQWGPPEIAPPEQAAEAEADPSDVIDVSPEMLIEPAPAEPRPALTLFHRESPRPMPRSTASWMVRTAVIWDRGFRRLTRRLGVLGWMMRSGLGRLVLGILGLTFWIVALVWLVRDWLQWTG